ncbi:MAG TPA: hypothetical protein VMR18_03495 [Candidatus Saccharimonadales bacterium]|nr:hypothetical protein [Candidatus Saccharimonadales bacterium]
MLEASWIALSAVYPQAFDENFHFGLIKVYSHYWLPFLNGQPANANSYGAVAVDPSYLYHYLMSFPYRFISLFVHGQTGQVILLRFINIGMFTTAIVLFRRVLLRARLSPAFTNISLAIFALIPIVPQLAAHINYDNLLLPLTAWVCLLTFKAIDELVARRPTARTLITLATVCLFTSIVKSAFLPIFLGVVIFVLFYAYKKFKGKFKLLFKRLWDSFRSQSWLAKTLLVVLFLVSLGLFAQRDGTNLVKYHTIEPNCSSVLSVKACEQHGAWESNYTKHLTVVSEKGNIHFANPIVYVFMWLYWMWYRLFFAINGMTSNFTNYPPLPLPSAAAAIIAIAGVAAVVKWRKKIFSNNPYIVFFLVISMIYIASLLIDGYAQYRYTNTLVTMNGRYLLPILLLVGAIVGRAFSLSLRSSPQRKTIIAVIALILFLQGGGVLTFITRSDPSWDWSNSAVVHVNNATRKLTKPIIIKGSKYYSTSIWVFN